MKITKSLLDTLYAETFDIERFRNIDPCGLVYDLMDHTNRQLDIELGAFFVAMITWGNRKAIRKSALHMLQTEMAWHPADFILSGKFEESYADAKNGCVYRTLNADKFKQVCRNFHALLSEEMNKSRLSPTDITLEKCLAGQSVEQCIETLTTCAAPAVLGQAGKSACKRVCMFMRWMVRTTLPDLGIWHDLKQSDLYAVMDVHVCQLTESILSRRQADWKTCCELTRIFRKWCPEDPLKYDISLMTLADKLVREGEESK